MSIEPTLSDLLAVNYMSWKGKYREAFYEIRNYKGTWSFWVYFSRDQVDEQTWEFLVEENLSCEKEIRNALIKEEGKGTDVWRPYSYLILSKVAADHLGLVGARMQCENFITLLSSTIEWQDYEDIIEVQN